MREELTPHFTDKDLVVPRSLEALLPATRHERKSNRSIRKSSRGWLLSRLRFCDDSSKALDDSPQEGVIALWPATSSWFQTTLPNRLKLNTLQTSGIAEPGHVSIRVDVGGGRSLEGTPSIPFGAVLLGATTLQEGGAAKGIGRKQMELFCADHHVTVDVKAEAEAMVIDVKAFTSEAPLTSGVSSFEAALQVVCFWRKEKVLVTSHFACGGSEVRSKIMD